MKILKNEYCWNLIIGWIMFSISRKHTEEGIKPTFWLQIRNKTISMEFGATFGMRNGFVKYFKVANWYISIQ